MSFLFSTLCLPKEMIFTFLLTQSVYPIVPVVFSEKDKLAGNTAFSYYRIKKDIQEHRKRSDIPLVYQMNCHTRHYGG